MEALRKFVISVSIAIFVICFYSFLVGNNIFQGKFDNSFIAWYFLAKGAFCSVALYLLFRILEKH
ncbi:MAG: hypothetical protein AB1481_06215 [Candidatus Omnitrophota bacterium]